jgi:hypothetical protein
MAETLATLREKIKRRLAAFNYWAEDEVVWGEGQTLVKLNHENVSSLVVQNLTDATEITDFTLDGDRGWVVFNAPETTGDTVIFTYKWGYWPDEFIDEQINAGVEWVGKSLYLTQRDETLVVETGVYSYTIPATIRRLVRVRTQSSIGTDQPLTQKLWYVEGDQLVFRKLPTSGSTIKLFGVKALSPFPLVSGAETLADRGLPEVAGECLVCYVCWKALEQRLIPAVRDNRTYGVEEERAVKVYEIQKEADRWKTLTTSHITMAKKSVEVY